MYNEEDYIDAVDNILKHVLKKQVKVEYHFDIIYVNLKGVFAKNERGYCGRRCLAALNKFHKIQQNEIEGIRGGGLIKHLHV